MRPADKRYLPTRSSRSRLGAKPGCSANGRKAAAKKHRYAPFIPVLRSRLPLSDIDNQAIPLGISAFRLWKWVTLALAQVPIKHRITCAEQLTEIWFVTRRRDLPRGRINQSNREGGTDALNCNVRSGCLLRAIVAFLCPQTRYLSRFTACCSLLLLSHFSTGAAASEVAAT